MTAHYSYSGDIRVDSLILEFPGWNYLPAPRTLYYTFDTNTTAFNASQRAAAAGALAAMSAATGITFAETATSGAADLHFGVKDLSSVNAGGICELSGSGTPGISYAIDAYIYLHNANDPAYTNCAPGTWGYETILHEVGHAMGLDHPFEGNPPLPAGQDNTNNTVMSYTDAGAYKTTYQQYDLLALRWIYGEDGIRGNYGFNSTYGPSLTLTATDTIAPTVASFSPADEASGVDIASNIVITFSENIQAGTGNIVLKTAAGIVVETYDPAFSSRLTFNGKTLTINPSADLNYATAYKVEFAAGSVRDAAGNGYAGTASYNFATQAAPVDVIAPTVSFFIPADEAKNVGINDNISITFSESILLGSGTIRLKDGAGKIIESFNTASGNISVAGNTLLLNPNSTLSYDTAYTVELSAAAVTDAAGNIFSGLSSYNFTTKAPPDTTAPVVLFFSPSDDAKNVSTSAKILIMFNEEIQRGAGNIDLKNATGIVQTFNANNLVIDGRILTITPSFPLADSTDYKVEFAAGSIRDMAGNNFAGTTSYNFTTVMVDKTGPAVTSFATPSTTTDNIVVQFDEAIQLGSGNVVLRDSAGRAIEFFNAGSSGKLMISDKSMIINPLSDLIPGTGYIVEIGNGAVKDLSGNSYNGNASYQFTAPQAPVSLSGTTGIDILLGGTGSDILKGFAGNDSLKGLAGNDSLDGGEGLDSAVYMGTRTGFSLTKTSTGLTITDKSGIEGTDTLTGIERVQFSDLSVAFDIDGNAGKAYRLYQAAFDRKPDLPGLGVQINALDKGASLEQIAKNFIDSLEFKNLYGAEVSHSNLVTQLYRNVLHREPEKEGFDHWISILETKSLSAAEVLYYFSESNENQNQVITLIANGIDFIPYA